MNGDQDDRGAYVRKVQAETHQYVQVLLEDNLRLRSALRTHEERLKQLELEVRATEEASRQQYEKFREVEENNSQLANLYVASYRLLGTLKRSEVLLAIQEIIANLIGSEEFGVYELAHGGEALELVTSMGTEAHKNRTIALGAGVIGGSAQSRRLFRADQGPSELASDPGVLVCIPLTLDERLIGVIAIFRLLQHKPRLLPVDGELFALLGSHAAAALCCSRLLTEAGIS